MGCQCSKEAVAAPIGMSAPVSAGNNPPTQSAPMHEGGSKPVHEQKVAESIQRAPEVPPLKSEIPVAAAPVTAPTNAHENAKPQNVENATKVSASKKKRMKKKAAKAAKNVAAGNVVDGSHGEEDASEDGSYIEEPARKEFVEAISSANQSYEAYYSADSEAPGEIRGRARR
jgi:hypothetical protein